jgi:hypothetical protein
VANKKVTSAPAEHVESRPPPARFCRRASFNFRFLEFLKPPPGSREMQFAF